jgi:hypothetical protein
LAHQGVLDGLGGIARADFGCPTKLRDGGIPRCVRSVDLGVPAALSCNFFRVVGGLTTCPCKGRVPLNFGAVNVVSRNILGAADGLAIILHDCTVDQATVNLATVSCNDNDQRSGFRSVGAAVIPAVILRDVRGKRPSGFDGISCAAAGPTAISCEGVVNRIIMMIQKFLYFCYIFVML